MKSPLPPKSRIHEELLENLFDGVCFVNSDHQITFWNEGAERITGRPAKSILGVLMGSDIIQHIDKAGRKLKGLDCPLLATVADETSREADLYLRHAKGFPISVLVKTFPIYNSKGKLMGAAEIFSDNPILSREKRRAKSLEQTILYDPLTLVGNRSHLEHKLRGALIEFQYSRMPFAVLFIDIDNFKAFNDTYGHNTGDKVLLAVANTLRHNLRNTDTAGRWGGEEFLAIAFDVDIESLKILAEKVRMLVEKTEIPGKSDIPSVTISIGATISRPGDTLESLVHRADQLMYKSKSKGKNCVSIG